MDSIAGKIIKKKYKKNRIYIMLTNKQMYVHQPLSIQVIKFN